MLKFTALFLAFLALGPACLKAKTIVIMGSDAIGTKATLHLAEAYKAKVTKTDPDIPCAEPCIISLTPTSA